MYTCTSSSSLCSPPIRSSPPAAVVDHLFVLNALETADEQELLEAALPGAEAVLENAKARCQVDLEAISRRLERAGRESSRYGGDSTRSKPPSSRASKSTKAVQHSRSFVVKRERAKTSKALDHFLDRVEAVFEMAVRWRDLTRKLREQAQQLDELVSCATEASRYIYIYIYIYMYIYIYIYLHMPRRSPVPRRRPGTYTYTYACAYTYTYTYTCICHRSGMPFDPKAIAEQLRSLEVQIERATSEVRQTAEQDEVLENAKLTVRAAKAELSEAEKKKQEARAYLETAMGKPQRHKLPSGYDDKAPERFIGPSLISIDLEELSAQIDEAQPLIEDPQLIADAKQLWERANQAIQRAEDELIVQQVCPFWFLRAHVITAPGTKLWKMDPHQTLLTEHPDWFELMDIDFVGASRKRYETKFCIVSHRWEKAEEPDPNGKQWAKIKEYLTEHKEIEYVWIECADPRVATCTSRTHMQLARAPVPDLGSRPSRCNPPWWPLLAQLLLHASGQRQGAWHPRRA